MGHCRPNVPPGNITLSEVQIGNRGGTMEEAGLPRTSMRGHRPKERMSAVMGESGELLQFSTQRPFQTLACPLATRKVYLARATVPLLTQVALKTFTTEAMWLIVQAMLS